MWLNGAIGTAIRVYPYLPLIRPTNKGLGEKTKSQKAAAAERAPICLIGSLIGMQ